MQIARGNDETESSSFKNKIVVQKKHGPFFYKRTFLKRKIWLLVTLSLP